MEIHVRLAGVQLGPYTAKQVSEYLTEGLLSATDQAREVGSTEWISVTEMLAKAGEGTEAPPATPAEVAPEATAEPEPQTEPEPEPQEEAEVSDAPQRAPSTPPGVTHLPTRQKDMDKIPLPAAVDIEAKKTILLGPTAPPVPSSSGRTGYSTMTTAPMSKTPLAGTKKVARSAVKSFAAQTAPLPTKSISPISKVPPAEAKTQPPPAGNPREGVTAHPTQTDDKKPRQSLLQSLTAKTVPMRTSAAPALPGSGSFPVTTPLPTKTAIKPIAEPPRPPSVVNDITKKLGRAPGSEPIRPPPAVDPSETETVKISLNKIKAADVAMTPPPAEPAEEREKPRKQKRSLAGLIYACAALALLLLYYVWSPYHAAAQLRTALSNGEPADLDSSIDFPSVRASLKDQIKAQLSAGVKNNGATEAALSNARDMIDRSIDLFVTPAGISGLVSKSGKFSEADLAQTISFSTASKIFQAFNAQPVKSEGLSSIADFAVMMDATLLHLRWQGTGWKLKQLNLRPDLLGSTDPDTTSALLAPVVNTYMEHGDAKAKKIDWAGAIADYSEVLGIAPRSSMAFNARGTARQSKGDLDGAMKDYTQALAIDSQMAEAYEGRGNVKTAKNDLDGAIADYTQAVHFNPTLAAAYDGRGNAKTAKDDLEGAIADYTQAITIDPTLASAFSDRGFARQANGNLDGAIADYTQALALKPKTAVAYYNRGLARQSQGNLEAAIVDYDRALAFDPKISGAYYNRGNAKEAIHDLDGAIADYTQAITLNPKIALAYCNRGVARQAKGDLDGAIADYTKALSIDPKIAIAYYNRGRIRELKNDPDGAIADSSQALDLDPKNAQAFFNRGFAKLAKGNLDGAQDDLKQFCEASPKDHDADHARLYIWLIAKAQNLRTTVDQELSDALENSWNASPDDLPSKTAAFLLGRLSETDYLAAANSPDAKKDQGQHCEAWYFAGVKRLLMGDKATATDYFHKSIATGQTDYCEYILSQAELKSLEPPPTPVPLPPPPANK